MSECSPTSREELTRMQKWPLKAKIYLTKKRIESFYESMNGMVYIAFSGGKDSTVLLHLVRQLFPGVPAVFAHTGLEFPEIVQFVRTIENVVWVRPTMKYQDVLNRFGYPVVSKKVSMGVSRYRNTNSELQKELRLWGGINPTSGKKQHPTIPKKYHYLVDAPFPISEYCCTIMKKQPFLRYEKKSERHPYIGTQAADSDIRRMQYLANGCNITNAKHPSSKPLSIWTENDIWTYIHKYEIPYSNIYNMGYDRTGCVFCPLGVHRETRPNRFERMYSTHPALWKYCMNKLGMDQVLDYLNIPRGDEHE